MRADFRTAVADIIAPTAMITATIIKNKAAIRAPTGSGRYGPGPQKRAPPSSAGAQFKLPSGSLIRNSRARAALLSYVGASQRIRGIADGNVRNFRNSHRAIPARG